MYPTKNNMPSHTIEVVTPSLQQLVRNASRLRNIDSGNQNDGHDGFQTIVAPSNQADSQQQHRSQQQRMSSSVVPSLSATETMRYNREPSDLSRVVVSGGRSMMPSLLGLQTLNRETVTSSWGHIGSSKIGGSNVLRSPSDQKKQTIDILEEALKIVEDDLF